jgi:Ca-activated chloride channel family protein
MAFVHCPLTVDYGAVRMFLDDLGPGMVTNPGTAIGEAIRISVGALEQGGENTSRGKAILLITDGEDHGTDLDAAVRVAKDKGIKIYVVGIGDPSGAPIPSQEGGFKKDASGNVILTKIDEAKLRNVAETTGGTYTRSGAGDVDLETVYSKGIKASVEDSDIESSREKMWHERFMWPVLGAFLLLMLDALVQQRMGLWRRRPRKAAATVALATVLSGWAAGDAWAVGLRQAHKAYEKKDFETALKGFSGAVNDDPADLENVDNESVTQYQLGKSKETSEGFRQSVGSANPVIRERSLYNLRNAQVGLNELKEASESYQKALGLDAKDEDAKANLQWVKQKIEEQKQQEQKSDKSDKSDKKDDKKQDSSSQ